MVVRDTAIERERSLACHFLHTLFFFPWKNFSLSCSSPPTECLELDEKRIIKGKITNKKRKKRKNTKKEIKEIIIKEVLPQSFNPFNLFFLVLIDLEILFLKSCLKVNGPAVFSIHIN